MFSKEMFDFQDEVISLSANQRFGIKSMKSNTAVFAGKCCVSSKSEGIKMILL